MSYNSHVPDREPLIHDPWNMLLGGLGVVGWLVGFRSLEMLITALENSHWEP